MNIVFKLALRNIFRSPGKFILQGAILFVLMFIVFISVSTLAGASKGIGEARRQFGREVRLTPNFDRAGKVQEGKTADVPYVTETLADKLLSSRYITAHNYYLWVPAVSNIRLPTVQTEKVKISPESDETDGNTYRFILAGNSSPDLHSDFANGIFKMISGGFPSREDGGEGTGDAVISRLLAEENGLGIGSTFTIYSMDLKLNQELKVAGIFDRSERDDSDVPFAIAANNIFVPLELARKFNGNAGTEAPADVLTYASYFLDTPGHLEAFINEAESRGIDMEKFRLDADDSEYRRITAQLRGLKILSGELLAAALAIGAAFTILYSSCALKKRSVEMGTLRTMGIGKADILRQVVLETVLVAFIALAAAGAAGASWASPVASRLLKEQVWMTETQSVTGVFIEDYGNTSIIITRPDTAASTTWDTGKTYEVVDEIEAAAGPGQVLLFLLAGLLVILCGMRAAALKVLRYSPMEALKGENGGLRRNGAYWNGG
jgi:ABC-type antimicrobial peptide transport system permease subunit